MTFRRNPQFDASLKEAVTEATRDAGRAVRLRIRQVLDDAEGSGIDHRRLPNPSSAPGEPPVSQSGVLFDSIQTGDVEDAQETVSIRIGSTALHSRFLEAGTQHMAPRPFLRPGLTLAKESVLETFRDRLKGGSNGT